MADFIRIFGILLCGTVSVVALIVSVRLAPNLETPKSLWLKQSIAQGILEVLSIVACIILVIALANPVLGFSVLSDGWTWLVLGIPIVGSFAGVLWYWRLDALQTYSRGLLNLSDYLRRQSRGSRKDK